MKIKTVAVILVSLLVVGCASEEEEGFGCVTLSTTEGDIVIDLDRSKAPNTVRNFLGYIDDSFYDGTIFHRVIDGFMIQGGGYDADLNKKTTKSPIVSEANNGLLNKRGTVAMARTNTRDSATSQFFINTVDNDFLNYTSDTAAGWGYAVFGQVVNGMSVVDSISKVDTGAAGNFSKDVPVETITIETVGVISCDGVESL